MHSHGFSLLETLVVLGVLTVVGTLAVPSLAGGRDDARARGGADHVASLFHLARLEALKRHTHVALRFEPDGSDFRYVFYADGNGNGVRTAEIATGIDRSIRWSGQVSHLFGPGVRIGVHPGVPGIDGDDLAGDPICAGRSRMISFGPSGTSTSGTVYLLGRGLRQFAIRVLGPTARVRTFEYRAALGQWGSR
jgi:prepilin-type N-terminal cleavage/methylation domain-containing protein